MDCFGFSGLEPCLLLAGGRNKHPALSSTCTGSLCSLRRIVLPVPVCRRCCPMKRVQTRPGDSGMADDIMPQSGSSGSGGYMVVGNRMRRGAWYLANPRVGRPPLASGSVKRYIEDARCMLRFGQVFPAPVDMSSSAETHRGS